MGKRCYLMCIQASTKIKINTTNYSKNNKKKKRMNRKEIEKIRARDLLYLNGN